MVGRVLLDRRSGVAAAVGHALDAYAATGATGSIEHAQLMTREDIPRMASLGIRASVQPAHLLDDRDLGEETASEVIARVAAGLRSFGGVAGTVQALRDNELFRRAVDLDPEWLLPYLLDRRGRSQDGVLEVLAPAGVEGVYVKAFRATAAASRSFAWLEGIHPLPEPEQPKPLPAGPVGVVRSV